ncbi:ulp1 protease family, C-terminal catalytic domain-containing protein [Tanacetum coccineum]
MSRFGTDSNAMLDSKAMVPAFSQPKPLNVLLGNIPYGKPRRNVMSHVDGPRSVLESLYTRVDIASEAIDLFTHVLNETEKIKNKNTVNRLFCHTAIVTNDMRGWEYENALRSTKFLDYISHVNHPKREIMRKANFMIMTMGCNTKNNFVDCGVFVMRHMETFKGDMDCCGFSRDGEEQIKELKELHRNREGSEQINELIDLRHKYAAKILLVDCNQVKKEFELEIHAFRTLPIQEKKRLEVHSFKTIKARVKHMMK